MIGAAIGILGATVLLAITRPRLGRRRLGPHIAALLGALACLLLGLVEPPEVASVGAFLWRPMLTLVSLMIVTLIADEVDLFEVFTRRLARAAGGDARKVFRYLFVGGVALGAVLTNDAAVLILTPLVVRLLDEIALPTWQRESRTPYYFAVLYVANLVGLLVISNPINLVVARYFDIGFSDYAAWMLAPGLVSIVVSYVGLRIYFRHVLPERAGIPPRREHSPESQRFRKLVWVVLALAVFGFFSQDLTGLPTWVVAMLAALVLLVPYVVFGGGLVPVVRGVAWDAILFVFGIFVVATAMRNAGLTDVIGRAMVVGGIGEASVFSTGLCAAGASAILNNHPVAGIMALVVDDLGVPGSSERLHALAALIGGDLGPKMLPIGSLAALLWFRLLRDRGVEISYGQYIRVGIPVTLAAVLASLATLLLESRLVGGI